MSERCPERPWTGAAGCPVRAGGHCRAGVPRGCGEDRPPRGRLSRACSPQLPLVGLAAAAAWGTRRIWVQPRGCGLGSRLGCHLTRRGSRTSRLAGLLRGGSGRQTGPQAAPEDPRRDPLWHRPPAETEAQRLSASLGSHSECGPWDPAPAPAVPGSSSTPLSSQLPPSPAQPSPAPPTLPAGPAHPAPCLQHCGSKR